MRCWRRSRKESPRSRPGRRLDRGPRAPVQVARPHRKLGGAASVDAIFEVFNLFNRTNYTEVNNIFGTGAYPNNPLPAFGQFQQAASPLQVQLAARINF